ncbi:hypothetical protein V6N13_126070 [Hibiscus sabdariffa]|uniref:Uncharacterized protein n=1 Tax=Hibiscus sabdariffa TaxID=183260 RepID=A0ABR2ASF6_9ROSI
MRLYEATLTKAHVFGHIKNLTFKFVSEERKHRAWGFSHLSCVAARVSGEAGATGNHRHHFWWYHPLLCHLKPLIPPQLPFYCKRTLLPDGIIYFPGFCLCTLHADAKQICIFLPLLKRSSHLSSTSLPYPGCISI